MSTNTIITRTNNTLAIIDNGNTITIPTPYRFTSDGYLKIPQNSTGRTLVKFATVENLQEGESYELKNKVEKNPNPDHTSHLSKKKMIELMTDEERELYNATIANAETIIKGIFDAVAARNTKTLTPEEKLRAKIAKLEAQLAAMNSED